MASRPHVSTADEARAIALLRAWRLAPKAQYACPVCAADGVTIEDRSARPHTEWYHFGCASCGLDHAISIPLGSRPPSLD